MKAWGLSRISLVMAGLIMGLLIWAKTGLMKFIFGEYC